MYVVCMDTHTTGVHGDNLKPASEYLKYLPCNYRDCCYFCSINCHIINSRI